jgi:transposase-like protein
MARPTRSATPATSRAPRRILTEDQKREVARLYSETTTPVPEIKKRFGIAESSLYRLIQQRGVAPRGRVPAATRPASTTSRKRAALNGAVTPAQKSVRSRSSALSGKYRVSFAAVQTITAKDIRDAIRQAEALGATTITAVTRSK